MFSEVEEGTTRIFSAEATPKVNFSQSKDGTVQGHRHSGCSCFCFLSALPLQQASMTHIDALADVARKGNLGEHPACYIPTF